MRLSAGMWCGNGLGELLFQRGGDKLVWEKVEVEVEVEVEGKAREWIGIRDGRMDRDRDGKSGVGCACLGRVG
jgi:hypothetical protein